MGKSWKILADQDFWGHMPPFKVTYELIPYLAGKNIAAIPGFHKENILNEFPVFLFVWFGIFLSKNVQFKNQERIKSFKP